MRDEKVVEHPPAVVSTEHVDPVVPGHDRVLAALRTDKLFTARHFFPAVDGLRGPEVEDQVLFLYGSLSSRAVRRRGGHGSPRFGLSR